MKNLAPDIPRQRVLIEGFYKITVNESVIREYFRQLAATLDLTIYGDPIIFSPSGLGSEENQGYDAFIPLIDSGISLYIWANRQFLSIILYTCKSFATETAIQFTQDFFQIPDCEHQAF
ncbi:MAG: hypothetical protein F6K03_08545 [Kamptonema sp. SIO4C4]|nr:hypothetical protein [Kamptonema sp. SIO4C4]